MTTTMEEIDEEAFLETTDEEPFLHVQDAVPVPVQTTKYGGFTRRFWISAGVNTLCTAAIIFVNKRIFESPSLRHVQVTFAAMHFAITALCLHLASSPSLLGSNRILFPRRSVSMAAVAPLAAAMIANVVLPNASLAYSSIHFYQVVRVLVTPAVALLNWVILRDTVPRLAVAALVPVCAGVAVVTYFDTQPSTGGGKGRGTSPLGVVFAFSGLLASAIYTVWIRKYQTKLGLLDQQLLLNQAPVSVLMMLYVIPFSDDVTVWGGVRAGTWGLILLSGTLATFINVSQFAIISEAGPVSSSVVGQFKTCCIFALGWVYSAKPLKDWSSLGVVLAMGGIIGYTVVIQRSRK